jgi:integrating conjugative element protein (TIGR03759 family)
MSRCVSSIGGILALAINVPALAVDVSGTQVTETDAHASTTDVHRLMPSERARLRVWDLSETEWRRYKALMDGIRGSISPSTISPIEVLGIHARDEDERQRYAERWARAMREDTDRILAFQRAYDEAGKRLYPNEPLIDIDRLPQESEKEREFQATDRLLFFTRPACPVCDVLLNKLLKRIDEVSGIDIFLSDVVPGDDAAVRDWAARQQIAPEWVHSRRVTLNHDDGALESLTRGQGEVPHILLRRGEDVFPLRRSDL